jgi:hypothetical protein
MNKLTLLLLAFVIQPGVAQRPKYVPPSRPGTSGLQSITVEQLEEGLAGAKEISDEEMAVQIDSVELTERLSPARLARCETYVRGRNAKQALADLADRSAFYAPPASEILSLAKPDLAAQKKMIALTSDFVINTLHHLPNFYATRVTTTFRRILPSEPVQRQVGKHSVKVYYRDGGEVTGSEKRLSKDNGLTTRGEFGPILALAILDAAKGNLVWSRWGLGSAGLEAVYAYEVTAANSHYEVDGHISAYKGEITVNPSSGAILRLVLKTDPDPKSRLLAADVAVDYGSVDIGGRTYICPLSSVALSQSSNVIWLNDVVFKGYHLFRGDSRILPGFTEAH